MEREARAISALNHPHICHVDDISSQDSTDYLVMEFLDGQTLAARLRKGTLPLNELLKVGIEVAEALETAHRAGIVHQCLPLNSGLFHQRAFFILSCKPISYCGFKRIDVYIL
jgi:serine/threonine protein kinase